MARIDDTTRQALIDTRHAQIEEPSRTPTVELGRRLVALHEECGRQDWSLVGRPEAAAIIQVLRERNTAPAREWLARAGVEVEARS